MGLLRDLLIKDPKTKRRVNMVVYLCVIIAFITAMFVPQLNDMAYEQGLDFGNSTCWTRISDYYNTTLYNVTGDFDVVGIQEGLSEA